MTLVPLREVIEDLIVGAWNDETPSASLNQLNDLMARIEHERDAGELDVDRLAPLLGREFGKAGFFVQHVSMGFLTRQARVMLEGIAKAYREGAG